jgi:hypothetical protein
MVLKFKSLKRSKFKKEKYKLPTKVCLTLSLVKSPPDDINALTPKSAICTEPSKPNNIFPALISL